MMKCSVLWRWNDHALPHPLARPATGCGTPDLPIDHALVGGPSLELPTWGKVETPHLAGAILPLFVYHSQLIIRREKTF